MDDDSLDKQILIECIEDIRHEIALLSSELERASIMKAPARRARKLTVSLTKTFKKFRKMSCELGLK